MDMMYQMIDQMQPSTNATQAMGNRNTAAKQSQDADGDDFDTMVRQKQQGSQTDRSQKPEANGTAAKAKKDAPTERGTDATQAEQDAPVIPDEQYAMAAALMFQMQPNVNYVQPEAQTEAVAAAVEATLPQAQEMQVSIPQSDIPQAAAQNLAQTVEQPVETAETKIEIPVDRAPETASETREPVFVPTDERTNAPEAEQAAVDFVPENRSAEQTQARGPEVQIAQAGEDDIPEENIQAETPVFEHVDAVPVRVAAPVREEAPVEMEAEDGVEQLGARIENFLTDENGDSRVELTLTPESLGKISVEITHSSDGSLHIQLSATTERAMNLLERNTGHLQNLLTTGSRPSVEVEVRASGESQQQFLNPNNDNGQHQQQNQQQRQPQQQHDRTDDFMQQLRLGLVDTDGET